jgi:tonB-dependent receptor plug domain-containing protein
LPRRLFGSTWVKGLSAFVSGANLLTISGEREVLELNVGSAPQTRYYNIGVKATF